MAKDILLSDLSVWNTDMQSKLKDKWITTADQVVAICSSGEGIKLISDYLEISIEELRALLELTRKHISPERLKELETPNDTSEYGLGVREPL